MIMALAGGVGGAKLAQGLARVLPPGRLLVVVNTGDDFEHLGLHISPDVDTVMYTLAGIANPETGWGLAEETWSFMAALERLGGETWFRLGDKDLATHIERTRRLHAGEPLSAITADFCDRLGVAHGVAPASDDPIRTMVLSGAEAIPFQRYFVERRAAPPVRGFRFAGAERASPSPPVRAILEQVAIEGVILCPSNPFVSIAPILAVPALGEWLGHRSAPVVAVSPIVGGRALKGPAAKMMEELGLPCSPIGLAEHYGDRIDGLVIDEADRSHAPELERRGLAVAVTGTVMRGALDRARLAREVVAFASGARPRAVRR
jgi:LPPG:FO 2-phospho-L-lactate transferase